MNAWPGSVPACTPEPLTSQAGFWPSPTLGPGVQWSVSHKHRPRSCGRPAALQSPPHPQLRPSQDAATEAAKSTRRWRPVSSDLGSVPRGPWTVPCKGRTPADPWPPLFPPVYIDPIGEEARLPCNLGVRGWDPPPPSGLSVFAPVLCLRCCDCTLLPPWDICISRLCNKCCILSRSCNSLGDGGQGAGGCTLQPPPHVSCL